MVSGNNDDLRDVIPPRTKAARGRRPSRFTQADVSRAIKGARKANLEIRSIDIAPDGRITIISGAPKPVASSASNPWDE
jgi:hypothetical protein